MKVFLHANEAGIEIKGLAHLASVITHAGKQAKRKQILSLIFLRAENGNSLGIVVGGDETMLHFAFHHERPPYYLSHGRQDAKGPGMLCLLLFERQEEFASEHVIPYEAGLLAVREFYESGTLPASLKWVEVQ